MRNALGKSLAKIFSQKKEHHLFSGDIGYRIFDELVRNSPSQFHNFGISEQHMVTFAASFAVRMESTSIVYTISPFITSRVHDQLRVDVAYRKAPLIICSVGAGFSYDSLGFTHFGIEDLGLIESLPKTCSWGFPPKFATCKYLNLHQTLWMSPPCVRTVRTGIKDSCDAR